MDGARSPTLGGENGIMDCLPSKEPQRLRRRRTDMRILIVGAGAVGGYFGGRLAEAGRDVTFSSALLGRNSSPATAFVS